MANLKNVIYLSNNDYLELVSTGTVTINGTTLQYSDDDVYITPDILASATENGLMSAEDKAKLDALATVATSGSYNDLSNKPTIGTATLTIQKNGSTVNTFSANATSNVTANITVPTKTSDLTNDSNFGTGTVKSVNSTSPDANGNVAITIPTTLDQISDGSTRKLSNYMPKSGGTFTGRVYWNDSNALPRANNGTEAALEYILGIRAFSAGGGTLYEKKSEFLAGYATETWVNNKGYALASSLGTAAAANTGTSSGNVPVLDSNGKIAASLLPDSVTSGLEYKGTFNATSGSTISGLEKGWYYICSTVGSKNPDGTAASSSYSVSDWAVYNGSSWDKIDNTDLITGVNNTTGAITVALESVSSSSTGTVAYIDSVNNTAASGSGTTQYLHFSAGTTPPSSATFNGTAASLVTSGTYKNLYASFSGTAVNPTFTGTATTTQTPSGTAETVASSSHTHTLTATGSVSLSGARTTTGTGSTYRRKLTITGSFSGTSATTSSISGTTNVASSSHTHSFTAQGSVTPFTPSGSVSLAVRNQQSTPPTGSVDIVQSLVNSDVTPAGTIAFTNGTAPSLIANTTVSGGIEYLKNYSVSGGTASAGTTKYIKVKVTNS